MGFLVEYWKHFRVIMVATSAIAVFMFYSALIPAEAVLGSGVVSVFPKYVGGAEVEMPDKNVEYNPSVPRNADGEKLKFVGTYKITHYCACTICTWGSGVTASGKPVQVGMIATDWKVLPQGTAVYIQGRGGSVSRYVVEDRGGAINGNRIDIYVPSHSQALTLGTYYAKAYVDP